MAASESYAPRFVTLQGMLLKRDEVELWLVRLVGSPGVRADLRSILSFDEVERAARFHFERDSNRYTSTRGLLRLLLATHMQQPPRQIMLRCNEWGKPDACESAAVRFNVSHSGELALLGFTAGREIGVDVECSRSHAGLSELAERFFARSEADYLEEREEGEKERCFLRCWTRKEAYIKGVGRGLSIPLDSFEVLPLAKPGVPVRLLKNHGPIAPAETWFVHDLLSGGKCAAAVAVPVPDPVLRMHSCESLDMALKALRDRL
jgi:4'-phosphopantetheinyl transferase